jgi:hypothetical protein
MPAKPTKTSFTGFDPLALSSGQIREMARILPHFWEIMDDLELTHPWVVETLTSADLFCATDGERKSLNDAFIIVSRMSRNYIKATPPVKRRQVKNPGSAARRHSRVSEDKSKDKTKARK